MNLWMNFIKWIDKWIILKMLKGSRKPKGWEGGECTLHRGQR